MGEAMKKSWFLTQAGGSKSKTSEPPAPTHSYVARRRSCGCAVAMRYDEANRPHETGRWVGAQIMLGRTIDRVALADLAGIELGCAHTMEGL